MSPAQINPTKCAVNSVQHNPTQHVPVCEVLITNSPSFHCSPVARIKAVGSVGSAAGGIRPWSYSGFGRGALHCAHSSVCADILPSRFLSNAADT